MCRDCVYLPQRTSPSISWTLHFHFEPWASSQSLTFKILLAILSTSLLVSSLPTAANTSSPLPIVETRVPSTVTDADLTRCKTAVACQSGWVCLSFELPQALTLHYRVSGPGCAIERVSPPATD